MSAAVFFIAVNAINLVNVRSYGETEFWFALIKVIAVIAMIIFGCYLLLSGHGGIHRRKSVTCGSTVVSSRMALMG